VSRVPTVALCSLCAFQGKHVRRQQHSVVRIGGHASRSHTLRSMPLLVLLRAAATREQVLLTDQGGIALFYADICAQFRLCLHSVRRQAQSTSPTETVWPPGYVLVVVFFAPCVLPLHAAASAPLLFVVVPLGVDVRTRLVVSASRALSLPGIDAVRLPLIVLVRQGSHYPWVILGGGWINLSVTGNGGPCQR
jgi:hypothetical protein